MTATSDASVDGKARRTGPAGAAGADRAPQKSGIGGADQAGSAVWALIRELPRVARGLTLALAVLILAQAAGSALLPLATGHLVAALTSTPKSLDSMTVGLALLGLVLILAAVMIRRRRAGPTPE